MDREVRHAAVHGVAKSRTRLSNCFFFIYLLLKISLRMKRHLLLGRKTISNLDGISKIRDITVPTKAHIVKAIVFPVVVYGYES